MTKSERKQKQKWYLSQITEQSAASARRAFWRIRRRLRKQKWKLRNSVKQFAESILFLQQHAIHDKKTLDALVDGSSTKYHELMKTIKDAEEKMAANKVIKTHIINYAKTRETYIAYRKSGYSKKFYEAHRDEITLHKAAKEAFSKLPDGKIPKVKDLNEEFVRLLSEKKAAYSEYKKIKKEKDITLL